MKGKKKAHAQLPKPSAGVLKGNRPSYALTTAARMHGTHKRAKSAATAHADTDYYDYVYGNVVTNITSADVAIPAAVSDRPATRNLNWNVQGHHDSMTHKAQAIESKTGEMLGLGTDKIESHPPSTVAGGFGADDEDIIDAEPVAQQRKVKRRRR